MGIFDVFADFLKGSVGNDMDNNPEDVRNTKRNLKNTGHFEDDTENDFLTRELDTGIKAFQQNNGLRVDGRVFPKGETEREIFRKVGKRDPDETFGLIDEINEQSIGFGGDVSGVITPIVPSPEDKPTPLALRDDDAQGDKQPEGKFVQTSSGISVNPEAILQRLTQKQGTTSEPEISEDKLAQSEPEPAQFDATGRIIREENNIPVPERKPMLSLKERKNAILDNSKDIKFNIASNPKADGSKPWYTIDAYSGVKKNKKTIEHEAKKANISPDLVKAIVYLETTQGYYDSTLPSGVNKTIRPMNIHAEYWKGLGYDRKDLDNPKKNVQAGVLLLKRISDKMPNASVDKIATIYNSLDARHVSDYGARVKKLIEEKPWNK